VHICIRGNSKFDQIFKGICYPKDTEPLSKDLANIFPAYKNFNIDFRAGREELAHISQTALMSFRVAHRIGVKH
jgi:hypothetical protein